MAALAAGLPTLAPPNDTPPLETVSVAHHAMRSALRMFAALGVSLAITFAIAPLAAKSPQARLILVPLLDVLQSVPVLAFVGLSATLAATLAGTIASGRLGAELACILTIAASQAWTMTLSLYQSLRTVPTELDEAARNFQLTGWQRFWRLEVPTGLPGLVWNMMAGMAGGWFYVVASEVIVSTQAGQTLPGIGSYLAQAVAHHDTSAIAQGLLAMAVIILATDQMLFRPLIAWSARFRLETVVGTGEDNPWMLRLLQHSTILSAPLTVLARAADWLSWRPIGRPAGRVILPPLSRAQTFGFYGLLAIAAAWGGAHMLAGPLSRLGWGEALHVVGLGAATQLRVLAVVGVATLIWVPLGVLIGLRPSLARIARPVVQLLASFPANLLFPLLAVLVISRQLNPDIWLTPLMLLGAQWFVLFNVLAGAQAFPADLREVSASLEIRGLIWWRRVILPAILPYYVTGAIAASGSAWNAAIVAELVRAGDMRVEAHGIGAYIADAIASGDVGRLVLGVFVLSRYVVVVNALLWQPLARLGQRRNAAPR